MEKAAFQRFRYSLTVRSVTKAVIDLINVNHEIKFFTLTPNIIDLITKCCESSLSFILYDCFYCIFRGDSSGSVPFNGRLSRTLKVIFR